MTAVITMSMCRWASCLEAAACEAGYCETHHRGACRGADAHGEDN